MPKLKTRKAVKKRFKITASKKVLRRRSKQNHFNARQTPDQRRNKRNDAEVEKAAAKNILVDVAYQR